MIEKNKTIRLILFVTLSHAWSSWSTTCASSDLQEKSTEEESVQSDKQKGIIEKGSAIVGSSLSSISNTIGYLTGSNNHTDTTLSSKKSMEKKPIKLTQEAEEQQKKMDAQLEAVAKRRKEKTDLTKQLSNVNNQLQTLQQERDTLSNENQQLQSDLSQAKGEVKKTNTQNKDLHNELKQEKGKVETLDKEKKDLYNQLKQEKEQQENQEKSYDTLQSKYDQLQAENAKKWTTGQVATICIVSVTFAIIITKFLPSSNRKSKKKPAQNTD